MVDSLNDATRLAASALIVSKRDALVAERRALLEQRSELLMRLRRVDRELADCRAAARLFALDIEFPPEDRNEIERTEAMLRREVIERQNREIMEAQRAAVRDIQAKLAAAQQGVANVVTPAPGLIAATATPTAAPSRPPLREVLLEQLRIAGSAGSKAAPLREFFERTYGVVIHEKTVGMTLYRLSQDNLVRRDGHTWFFGPAVKTGAENPGVAAPGSVTAEQ